MVGATFEAGAHACTLMGNAFASMLVFWLEHVWSEVVGEHISSGTRLHARVIPVIARRAPLSAVILGVGQGILGVLLLVLDSLIH